MDVQELYQLETLTVSKDDAESIVASRDAEILAFQDDKRLKASQWSALRIALESALELVDHDIRLLEEEDDDSMRAARTFDELKARAEFGVAIGYISNAGYIHAREWDGDDHGASSSPWAISALSRTLKKAGQFDMEAGCFDATVACFKTDGGRNKSEGLEASKSLNEEGKVERYSDYGSRRSSLVRWLRASRVTLKELIKSARQASEL